MVSGAFNPSIQEAEAEAMFNASPVYRENFRTAKAIQRNPVSKPINKQYLFLYLGMCGYDRVCVCYVGGGNPQTSEKALDP